MKLAKLTDSDQQVDAVRGRRQQPLENTLGTVWPCQQLNQVLRRRGGWLGGHSAGTWILSDTSVSKSTQSLWPLSSQWGVAYASHHPIQIFINCSFIP